jgi:hypothetical protein
MLDGQLHPARRATAGPITIGDFQFSHWLSQ